MRPPPFISIPVSLWTHVLDVLGERIATADYLAPESYDDADHEANCLANAKAASVALEAARRIVVPDTSAEAEARRNRILNLAEEQQAVEGQIEIPGEALVSEGGDNGCYVSAWAWVSFEGTELSTAAEINDDEL